MPGTVALLLWRHLLWILRLRLLVLGLWRLVRILLTSFLIGNWRWLRRRWLVSLLVGLVRLLRGLVRLLVRLIGRLLLLVRQHRCSSKDTCANNASHDKPNHYAQDGGEQSANQEQDPEVASGGKEYNDNYQPENAIQTTKEPADGIAVSVAHKSCSLLEVLQVRYSIAAVGGTPVDIVLVVDRIEAAGMDAVGLLLDMFLVTERVPGVGSLAGRAHWLVVAGTLAVAADLPVMRPRGCRYRECPS